MERNDEIVKNIKFGFYQKCIFKLLSQIQYGQVAISDAYGLHVFNGNERTLHDAVHLRINDLSVYKELFFYGSIALGESYMAGEWDVDDLSKFLAIMIKNTQIFYDVDTYHARLLNMIAHVGKWFLPNNISRSKKNILAHYDLGNEFFQQFLDPSMMYSCALFEPNTLSLEEAATLKVMHICQQLELKSSDHLLEIGTGWGTLAIYAAQNYGCTVTTTTISDQQYQYVKKRIASLGLEHQIHLLNKDYRELDGQYDKLVSVEMIEAIGHQYFTTFFKQCNKLLKPGGLFLLQAILINDQSYTRATREVDFIRKYIFPGGCLPSMQVITNDIAQHTELQLMNLNDIGLHYAQTLAAWLSNFNRHVNQITKLGFSETFIRMWRYYFCYCIAAFQTRYVTDIQALWRKRD